MAEAANPETLSRAGRAPRTWLAVLGAVAVVVGLVVGFAAKRAADIASYVASQPTRLLGPTIVSPTQMTGPTFDPSSAHYVAPDYTLFWIGMAVAAAGIIAVIGGLVATRDRTS